MRNDSARVFTDNPPPRPSAGIKSKGEPFCHHLETPLQEDDIRKLRAGDFILLSGTVFTARDAAHQRLARGEDPPVRLRNSVVYHCGPVVMKNQDGTWRIIAAGPTTSQREESYMSNLIERFNLRIIMGKGGMGRQTLQACQKFGCAYMHAVGGAAGLLAQTIQSVDNLFWPESGLPEAIWQLTVVKFPAVVTMDSHGRSIHEQVRRRSRMKLNRLA